LLLIEGTNLVEAACQADYKLDIIFYTEGWQQNHQSLCRIIADGGVRVELVSPEILNAIATTVNPDGVVAIAAYPTISPEPSTIKGIGLAVERLQDPGNLGTIVRTAVATGVETLWLSSESVDFYSPKVLRASVGQCFRLPVVTNQDLPQLVKEQQQQGVQIIATTSKANKTYWEVAFTRPSLILLGNEGAGLSPELIDLADVQLKIPLTNQVESLNVAVASALLLYEAQRQLGFNNNQ
jgi:RNA methyltransferase, TrmH family